MAPRKAAAADRKPEAPPVQAWPIDTLERRPVADLLPYAKNARKHSAEQIDQIARSITEWGWTMPILVDEGGEVIAGHARLEAAKKLGIAEAPVMVATGWSPAQKKAYVIADNQLALNSTWDAGLLRAEIGDLKNAGADLSLIGFPSVDLDKMLAEAAGASDEGDEVPAMPKVITSRTGDLWLMGACRLLCGDSTDPAAVSRLMGDDRASLLFTSPPYGSQRDYTTGGISNWDRLMEGVFGQLDAALAEDGQVIVNLGMVHREGEWLPYWQGWVEWMRTRGWRRFGLYVWDQGPGLPGDWNGRLAPAFEFIFHFNRQARQANKITPNKWAGTTNHGSGLRAADGQVKGYTAAGADVQDTRIPDSVVRITRHKARGIEIGHPAVFPVALGEFALRAYSDRGDAVFEPFSGSGTTLVACERLSRKGRAIELAPEYVDLAVARFRLLFPDLPVTLEGDGRTYDQVATERANPPKPAAVPRKPRGKEKRDAA